MTFHPAPTGNARRANAGEIQETDLRAIRTPWHTSIAEHYAALRDELTSRAAQPKSISSASERHLVTMADRPQLDTPPGGAMTQPHSPAQWHGYPFVWAWYVNLASLDTTFIEMRCREANAEGAPADAAYKTGPDNHPPDTWITVAQLSENHRDRIRDYGNTLLRWERDLKSHREGPVVQPLHAQQSTAPRTRSDRTRPDTP
ncbi:hypothetical protein [Streptomyces sp. NPDC055036]